MRPQCFRVRALTKKKYKKTKLFIFGCCFLVTPVHPLLHVVSAWLCGRPQFRYNFSEHSPGTFPQLVRTGLHINSGAHGVLAHVRVFVWKLCFALRKHAVCTCALQRRPESNIISAIHPPIFRPPSVSLFGRTGVY